MENTAIENTSTIAESLLEKTGRKPLAKLFASFENGEKITANDRSRLRKAGYNIPLGKRGRPNLSGISVKADRAAKIANGTLRQYKPRIEIDLSNMKAVAIAIRDGWKPESYQHLKTLVENGLFEKHEKEKIPGTKGRPGFSYEPTGKLKNMINLSKNWKKA